VPSEGGEGRKGLKGLVKNESEQNLNSEKKKKGENRARYADRGQKDSIWAEINLTVKKKRAISVCSRGRATIKPGNW